MKKLFTLISVAIAGTAMMYGSGLPTIGKLAEVIEKDANKNHVASASGNLTRRAVAKANESQSLIGYYDAKYTWWLVGEDPFGSNPIIRAGENEDEYIISNFPNGGSDIKANLDADARKLVINEQFLYVNSVSGKDVYLQIWDDEAYEFIDSIYADIAEDGTLTFQPNLVICYHQPVDGTEDGFLFAAYNVVFSPIASDVFIFDPSEWSEYGTALYCDHTITSIMDYDEDDFDTLAVEVPIYRHKTIPGDFLLVNPFVGDTDWGMTMEEVLQRVLGMVIYEYCWVTEPGYVRFNVADPKCVYVYPFVGSGVKTASFDEFFLYNREGEMIVTNGYTVEQTKNTLYDDYTDESVYDFESNTAYIYNCVMGFTSDMLMNYLWVPQYPGEMRITFDYDGNPDPNPEESGIKAVETNVETKYYNLQGNELTHPEKGQIVIKRTGDKTEKIIAR